MILRAPGCRFIAADQQSNTIRGPSASWSNWRSVMGKVDPKVDEAIETLNMKDGPTRRRLIAGTGLFSATAAASALLTAACSSSTSSTKSGGKNNTSSSAIGDFPKTPAWQFWYVNHVTTNLFFVPTQSGFKDAATLLGLPEPKWGGST